MRHRLLSSNNDRADTLNDLVGKQVRVNGRVTDRGDLNAPKEEKPEGGNIDAGDLARVDVITVDKIDDACSSAPPHNE